MANRLPRGGICARPACPDGRIFGVKRVVVDAFGGDNAPQAVVEGCVTALSEIGGLYLILTGDEEKIREELSKYSYDSARVEIRHAPDIIANSEHPVQAVRTKKNSSLVKALEVVAAKEADVFVSAGSTGAVLAGATFIVKRIRGVKRPALAPILPTVQDGRNVLLIDCGANVDCKPINLQQFAIMGSAYAEKIMGVKNPRVGLLNNGAEAEKGCDLTKTVYQLLQQTPVNFTGNCEGRDILSGDFDVVVADGFAGNVALKSIEGTAGMLMSIMKKELMGGFFSRIGALMAKPAFRRLKHRMDYSEHGGALLLGIDGGIIKAHGSCSAKAFAATLRQACAFIDGDVVNIIRQSIQALPLSDEQ